MGVKCMGKKLFLPSHAIAILYYTHTTYSYNSLFFFFISYHLSVAFFEDDKFRHDSPGAPRRQLCNVHELARALSSFYGTRTCAKPLTTSDTHTFSLAGV